MKKVSYLLAVDPLTQILEGNGQFFETVRVGDSENDVKFGIYYTRLLCENST